MGRVSNFAMATPYTVPKYMQPLRRVQGPVAIMNPSRVTSRLGMGLSRTRTQTTTRTQSAPITGHYDYKTDYRKRRRTRRQRRVFRRRRRWRRKIVRTVRESTLGTAHVVRRSFQSDVTTAAGQTQSGSYTMYGLNGQSNVDYNTTNDMGSVLQAGSGSDWTNWESTTLDAVNHKLYAYHATMEFTMTNTGGVDALVEMYYIRARNRVDSVWSSPDYVFAYGFKKQGNTTEPDTGTAVGTALTPNELGVTPFQNSLFCRMFNIYKRQKFRIPVGGEVSFVLTDRRSRVFSIAGTKQYAWDRGMSGIFFQFQGVAVGGSPSSPAQVAKLTFNCTRRYRLKFARDDNATDARVP